ncbi:hypothetical protein LWF01_04880 [Saxibacter everestensis]|uniref:Secreted protein n=1 Tax=Saxibacter everestensis TaxID=2909229 RepID=A0ABY8QVP3_9MICO|nr:hypothetical protein LWF01_04880 [Brevibacteriaceae bacterium ZFBP1038]
MFSAPSARRPARRRPAASRLAVAATLLALTAGTITGTAATAQTPSGDDRPTVTGNADGSEELRYPDGSRFRTQPSIAAAGTNGHGSFRWSSQFKKKVNSRSWKTGKRANVYVKVNEISRCNRGAIKLELRDREGDRVGTTRKVGCSGGSYVWKLVRKGTYYFVLTDDKSARTTHVAKGDVRYD